MGDVARNDDREEEGDGEDGDDRSEDEIFTPRPW